MDRATDSGLLSRRTAWSPAGGHSSPARSRPDKLYLATWRKAPRALDRWALGTEHDATLARIRDLQGAIASTPARTLADAAVLLRRLIAWLDDGTAIELRMLRSALDVVEGEIARDGTGQRSGLNAPSRSRSVPPS